MTTATIVEMVFKFGVVPGLLFLAVLHLDRRNEANAAKREVEYQKMDDRRESERQAFRDERDKRLALLEQEVRDCKEDRRLLHATVDALQTEVRGLMRKMIDDRP